MPAIVSKNAHAAFALAGQILHPSAVRPETIAQVEGISPLAVVHPTASVEAGVTVEPYAVIGRKCLHRFRKPNWSRRDHWQSREDRP